MIINGAYIKRLRNSVGITQKDLAKRAGITQAHVAKIENDKVDPRLSTINSILLVLEKKGRKKKAKRFMNKPHYACVNDKVSDIMRIMRDEGISQMPVMEKDRVVGSIKESTIIDKVNSSKRGVKAGEIMDRPFPIVSGDDEIEIVKSILDYSQAVLVSVNGKIKGIITRSDVMGL